MSVLIKDRAGDYWLYSKGADSTMLPIIIEGKINEVIAHVTDFSMVKRIVFYKFNYYFLFIFSLKEYYFL